MAKRFLIVEEALRDLKAHWFEYIKTINGGAQKLGWEVDVACNKNADPVILEALNSFPIFNYAKYLDNDKKKLPGEKHYGFILHSFRTKKALSVFFKNQAQYDQVFVPTVLMHHLLAWYSLMTFAANKPRHVTLFFVTNPGVWDSEKKKSFFPKSTVILKYLLKLFGSLVKAGKITFAVETKGAKAEFEALSGLPFKLLPHPVPFDNEIEVLATADKPLFDKPIGFACYGFARHEKGSDLFKAAIEQLLEKEPELNAHFSIQWTDTFKMPDGTDCGPGEILTNHPKVTVINRAVMSDEYNRLLAQTDCMVLPYRNSSYHARVSRVAIEAAANAIPMIYTKDGWLEETVVGYGAGIGILDEDVQALTDAIKLFASESALYKKQAIKKKTDARVYYSANNFCKLLLGEDNN